MDTKQYTLSQIAYLTGFRSPSYFTKSFKEQYGKAPSEYIDCNKFSPTQKEWPITTITTIKYPENEERLDRFYLQMHTLSHQISFSRPNEEHRLPLDTGTDNNVDTVFPITQLKSYLGNRLSVSFDTFSSTSSTLNKSSSSTVGPPTAALTFPATIPVSIKPCNSLLIRLSRGANR